LLTKGINDFVVTGEQHYGIRQGQEAFVQTYLNEKKSQTLKEQYHVKTMADAMWRLNRVRRFENEIIEQSLGANPLTDSDERLSRELMKLNRYEKAIESSFHGRHLTGR
jgi:hypothetical protein